VLSSRHAFGPAAGRRKSPQSVQSPPRRIGSTIFFEQDPLPQPTRAPAAGRVTVDNDDETVRLTIHDKIGAVAVVDLYPDEVLKLALRLFGVVRARRR
jgi:hypothetical protein